VVDPIFSEGMASMGNVVNYFEIGTDAGAPSAY
jgi:hypothetical protein